MKRTALTTVAAAALALTMVGTTAAQAAESTSSAASRQDRQYLKANDQVNLTEIKLANWIEHHLSATRHPFAHRLAVRTKHDHRAAQTKARSLAKRYDIALPAHPNAEQQRAFMMVKDARYPAYRYFKVQVAGHKEAVAATKYEIAHGSNSDIVAFARSYLPVASMHLVMARKDLRRWVAYHRR